MTTGRINQIAGLCIHDRIEPFPDESQGMRDSFPHVPQPGPFFPSLPMMLFLVSRTAERPAKLPLPFAPLCTPFPRKS